MIKNIAEKKDYIVISSTYSGAINSGLKYCLKNVLIIDDQYSEIDNLITYLNSGKIKLVIFVDFINVFRKIVPNLKNNICIKWIFSYNIASFTNQDILNVYKSMIEYYDRDFIDEIYCVDKSTVEVLKKSNYNVKHLVIDYKEKINKPTLTTERFIGVVGNDYDVFCGFYNGLTAIKLLDKYIVRLIPNVDETPKFLKFFDIKNKLCETEKEVLSKSSVNILLYFTNMNMKWFIISMDMGIPCILGNTDIFDNYPVLKNALVLRSDDDVNEIAKKIEDCAGKTDIIKAEYKFFRSEYTKKSLRSIGEILGGE